MNLLNAAQRMQMIEKFEALTMNEYEALNSEIEQLRQRVAELERFYELDTKQIAYLFEERDALMQQRDELLKACETYMSHGICDVTYYTIRNAIASVKGGSA